jgi:hypothetical protein
MAAPSAPGQEQILNKRAITCLTVGSTATATWTNSNGQTCTFAGVVGSNYGTNSAGEGEYVTIHPILLAHNMQDS